jgi:DNA-binding transcriptional LysR family regulator
MNVSLQQLKVFVAVARQRSFTRAAREFDLTQSAVSRCVRELEEAISLRLFDRTTRNVELTLAGASLARRIGQLLDEIDLTLREERAAHHGHTGIVTIASNAVLSSRWVPECIARCIALFPGLSIDVKDQPQDAVLASVEQGDVDFGLVSDFDATTADSLHVQPLFTTPLCAVLPDSHSLARGTTLMWSALSDAPLVTLNADAGSRASVERALAAHRVPSRRVQECGHVAAVMRMIELGLGIGVLPVGAHWPAPSARLVARPLLPEVTLTTMLVRHRNRTLRPNAQAVWSLFSDRGRTPGRASGAAELPAARSQPAIHEPLPALPSDVAPLCEPRQA